MKERLEERAPGAEGDDGDEFVHPLHHPRHLDSRDNLHCTESREIICIELKIIFIELMTSDCKLEVSREGSN